MGCGQPGRRTPDIVFRDELDALDLPTRVKTMLLRAGVHEVTELDDLYEHAIARAQA